MVGGLESPSMVSGVTTASDSWLATADPAKGDYLGRFFPDDKGQLMMIVIVVTTLIIIITTIITTTIITTTIITK